MERTGLGSSGKLKRTSNNKPVGLTPTSTERANANTALAIVGIVNVVNCGGFLLHEIIEIHCVPSNLPLVFRLILKLRVSSSF